MIQLRPYQRETLDSLYRWYATNEGNPCVVACTGAGKTVLIAQFCKENLETHPNMKILVITHVKELIEQDYNKLLDVWPDAPCGIYSAGIRRRDTEQNIIFCGVQSIRDKTSEFGNVNVIIVDEAHLISHKDTGSYRKIIKEFNRINPKLSVIGFTATPFRLGHGMITDEPAIFSKPLIQSIGIEDLQKQGYLAYLRSKMTDARMDVEGVEIRNHEYVENQLQAKIDEPLMNSQVVEETLKLARDRRHILFFCCGVDHARHICEEIRNQGETADYLVGNDDLKARDEKIARFKAGETRCLTNVNVLSIGFDYPDIDCIVMMRPTMSPGLYIQQAGRGLRPKSDGGDCLVLDFAGNVAMHGPITHVRPPRPKGERQGQGVAPSKVCPICNEIVAIQSMECPCCGYKWPIKEKARTFMLHDDDIQGGDVRRYFQCEQWMWMTSTSKKGNPMVIVDLYGKSIRDGKITDHFMIWDPGYIGNRARTRLLSIMRHFGLVDTPKDNEELNRLLLILTNVCTPPFMVRYEQNGKYRNVVDYIWKEEARGEISQA